VLLDGILNGLREWRGRDTRALTSALPTPIRDGYVAEGGEPNPSRVRQHLRPLTNSTTRRQYPPLSDHAEGLLSHIRTFVDPEEHGLILHADILEFYTCMLEHRGWQEQSWASVDRAFDLLTTGGRKPYVWIITKSGRKARRRHYPIPPAAVSTISDFIQGPAPGGSGVDSGDDGGRLTRVWPRSRGPVVSA
jgi:hypothetical protein